MRVRAQTLVASCWLLGYVLLVNLPTESLLKAGIVAYLAGLLIYGLYRPRGLFLVWLALVPIRSRLLAPWRVSDVDLSFDRLMLGIAITIWLLHKMSTRWPIGRRVKSTTLVLLALAVVDVAADFLGDGALGPSARHSIVILVEVIGIPLLYQDVFSRDDLPALVEAFGVGAVVLGACSLVERLSGEDLLLRFPTSFEPYVMLEQARILRDGVLRVRGPFPNPVYLGGFVPLMMFAGLYLAVLRQRRLLGSLVIAAGLAAAVLCVSRTAVYAVAVFVVPALLILPGRIMRLRVNRLGMAFGLCALLLAALYLAPDFGRSVEIGVKPTAIEGANATSRFALFSDGLPMMAGSNPFGIGFDDQANRRMRRLGRAGAVNDIANFYIGYGLSKGWIWLAAFIGCTLLMGLRLLRSGMTGLLLAALLLSLLASYVSYAEFWITFPVFLTFVLVYQKHRPVSGCRVAPSDGLEVGR